MPRERRKRRRRGATGGGGENALSALIPNVIEKPAVVGIHGVGGLVGNLLSDVADSVVGLPFGLVNLTKHPIKTGEAVGQAMAHTWSPLFQGHPMKFLEQTYDHPLAPILDVATVFTLGAGAGVKGAQVVAKAGEVGEVGRIAKIASVTKAGTRTIKDPAGVGMSFERPLSRRAGRRVVQETMMKIDDAGYIPKWYRQTSYNRAKLTTMAHNSLTTQAIKQLGLKSAGAVEDLIQQGDTGSLIARMTPDQQEYVANRLQAEAMVQGAEAVERLDEVGKRARMSIPSHMYTNLVRHSNKIRSEAEVQRLLAATKTTSGRGRAARHYGVVYAPEHLDTKYARQLAKEERKHAADARQFSTLNERAAKGEARLKAIIDKHEANAARLPALEKDLAEARNELSRLRAEGHIATAGTEMAPEWAGLVRDLRNQLVSVRASAKKLDEAKTNLARLKQQRIDRETHMTESFTRLEDLRNRAAEDYFAYAGESYDALTKSVNGLASRAVGHDLSKALRDEQGNFHVVPLHDAYNLSYEGAHSLRFLHKLIHTPSVLWKQAVLLYTPRIVTNNGVGNWFLYAVRNPSRNSIRAMYDTLRSRYGSEIDAVFPHDHWLYRWFGDEMLADTFATGADIGLGPGGVNAAEGRLVRGAQRTAQAARGGFYGIQYQLAEKPVRAASIRKALYDMPEIRDEMLRLKRKGVPGPKALDQAIENVMSKRPDLREAAALESRRVAGDYISLNEGEKFARDIIPFYLWQRHILKTTGNMFLDQPGTLAVGSRLSDFGIDELRKELGDLPDFLRGVVPLTALGIGDKPGRANVLLTSSLNPFATVGDMADGVNAWVTGRGQRGSSLIGLGVSPFLTGPIESATQVSLLTGAPSPRSGGIAGDTLARIIAGLPYVKTAQSVVGEKTKITPSGNEYLYARDAVAPASWLTGFTVKDMSLATAAAIAAKERGETVTRRRHRRKRKRR